jgi:hypothetical protein
MNRHFYISDDLDDLELVEEELESNGISTPHIHVLSLNDSEVARHKHLHEVEAVLRTDVVRGTKIGALVGVISAAGVITLTYLFGWAETVTWLPFVFLAIMVLGFCTWEGGLIGIQIPNHQFKRFQKLLKQGKHIIFVDVEPEQEAILSDIVEKHPKLKLAGTGNATPGWVVHGQEKFTRVMKTLP